MSLDPASRSSDGVDPIEDNPPLHTQRGEQLLEQGCNSAVEDLRTSTAEPDDSSNSIMPPPEIEVPHTSTTEPDEPSDSATLEASSPSQRRSNQASRPTPTSDRRMPKRLPMRRSVGNSNFITLFLGSILISLALAFLIFLWTGEGPIKGGARAPDLWRTIALKGKVTLSVTLTSLVLRIASASQAGICTAIVAALVLERRRFPLSHAAKISMTRANTSGEPQSLLWAILSLDFRNLANKIEIVLLFILAVTSIGLQFSSTLLVSSIGLDTLVQYPSRKLLNLGVSSKTYNAFSDRQLGAPEATMSLFAEKDLFIDRQPNKFGVTDAGLKQRALLPFNMEDRVRLQSFDGALLLFTSRTRCMRPSMTAKLLKSDDEWPTIEVKMQYNQTYRNAGFSPPEICYGIEDPSGDGTQITFCLPHSFNCTLPNGILDDSDSNWYTALCNLPLTNDRQPNGILTPAWIEYDQDPIIPSSGAWPQLAFATNLPTSFWRELSRPLNMSRSVPYEEWSSYEIQPGRFLNASFCMTGLNAEIAELSLAGNVRQKEPDVKWNNKTASIETGPLQVLLGTDDSNRTLSQRGILEIVDSRPKATTHSLFAVNHTQADDAAKASVDLSLQQPIDSYLEYSGGYSITVCTGCNIYGYDALYDSAALFQDLIGNHSRAAVAIESYYFMLVRSSYYSYLPALDVPGYANVTFTTEAPVPTKWNGFAATIALAVAHSATVWAIVVVYAIYGRRSMIGNFWHAAALLASEATLPVLRQGGRSTDKEIAKALKADNPHVGLDLDCGGEDEDLPRLSRRDPGTLGKVERPSPQTYDA
ncbi:hypothetical protein F4808DRAFT_472782 [Astrocystis sublimbata]|nr:hypothetical protein F4808DRAFT_472782 [Astrocystis sublimbata]